ncbi:hypothetical protein [Kutzneria sp. CA-103260]|uniref:hypothetical protein n=1 Tax=Kutzneria sp. CA-103260 TaxID=2802641 RepID=UPI001BA6134F|nr:hypothetical protein [Kutzneria sp. CA-103260]QUQ69871.1 hypothetical protein JJ691_76380 [Kutzneria sp. CA-103260]
MEDTRLSFAVWRPAEQWQTEDPAVELRMQVYARRGRTVVVGFVVSLALAVVASAFLRHLTALSALFLLSAVLTAIGGIRHQLRLGGWLKAAKDLLTGNPSHRVAARVVAHKGNSTVLAVGQTHLRVRPVSWGIRQVIARTGEITMVGPDTEGHAVVFVDGQPTPLPAKVVEAPEPTEAEPIARVSANGAEDEVPRWYATRHARIQWIPFGYALIVLAALAYDAQQARYTSLWIYVVVLVACLVGGLFRVADQVRLPKLLAAGQWRAHPVTVEAWKGDARRPFADLTLKLGVPGGEQRLVVKHASAELVANISATGTLWMVGTPRDNKSAAVGVPGHPILAPARFA